MRATNWSSIAVLGAALVVPPAAASASETVRTIRAELSGADASHFAVENLLGAMRIAPGSGTSVEVIATVHAETAELADAVRLERVDHGGGSATLRVRYPYDKVSTFKYREPSDDGGFFFGWSSSESYDYDGHRIRVNRGKGTALHADLEVRVPSARIQGSFSSLLGLIDADSLQGELKFRVDSADLRLRRLDGAITLEGSSGDIRARDIKGTWSSVFSSGDCDLAGFEGDTISIHTTSGDADLRQVRAKRADFDSTSGDLRLSDADLQEFQAEASSGDITFEATGLGLREVGIRTSSGDVALRLPSNLQFDVDADQSSGDMDIRFSDGEEVSHRHRLVGYRRGTGGARIHVRTASGDLTVTPG
jgi:DUF4097 and DUF4098 domain-containing protein YvlB